MNQKVLYFNVPEQTAGRNREFCLQFEDLFIIHKKEENFSLEAFHNSKKVLGGIEKEIQMIGNPSIVYNSEITNTDISYDIYVEEPSFLLQDNGATNYLHFFFCFFGKCFYYDELTKNTPLKMYIPESIINSTENTRFIKEWLEMYYPNLKIETLSYNKRYKFKNIILPNSFYCWPQPFGYKTIYKMIRKVVDKIPVDENLKNKTAYISRQDTIKRGWWHKRTLENELELIEEFKKFNYDIIELMDYDMKDKIKIFKSYKNIIQQHGASTIGILFSSPKSNHFLLEHPKMSWWATPKCKEFAELTKSQLITIEGFGELIQIEKQTDENNYPWRIKETNYLVENINKMIDN